MTLTAGQVVRWWELRRLPYNFALLLVGLLSIVGFEWLMDKSIPLGEDAMEPLGLTVGVFAYGLMANVCYTSGWIGELYLRKANPDVARALSRRLFLAGLALSCVLTSTPFWFACLFYAVHRLRKN